MSGGYGAVPQQQMFAHRLPEALHQSALDLSLMRQRIDYRTDIVRADHSPDANLAGLSIDFDFRDRRYVARHVRMSGGHVGAAAGERQSLMFGRPRHERFPIELAAVARDEPSR